MVNRGIKSQVYRYKVDLNKVLFYRKKEKLVDRDVLIQLFGWTGASLPQKRTINRI